MFGAVGHPPQQVVDDEAGTRRDVERAEQWRLFAEHEWYDADDDSHQHDAVVYLCPWRLVLRFNDEVNDFQPLFVCHLFSFFRNYERNCRIACIKTMQRIENSRGYGIEIVLNSLFCYKLPKRAPDSESSSVSWLIIKCKGTTKS